MAEATNPIATASNPRVGEDGLGDGRAICEALGFDPTNHHNAERCPYCNPKGWTLQPSPEAGAGGDLGELESLSKAAPFPIHLRRDCLEVQTEAHRTNNAYLGREMAEYVFALVNAHRSGKLVASTGSGKGETKGEPSGTGSREPGPSVPASGFDPSRVEAAAQAYYDGMIGDERTQWPHHDGWAGKSEAFKSKVRAHMARALDAALGTEARSAETFGLGPKDDGPACKATPEATPKSSPSQTPVAWKYEYCIPNGEGVWEQRVSLDQPRDGHWIRALEPLFGKSSMHDRAETTEAALRTLQAAGEVR